MSSTISMAAQRLKGKVAIITGAASGIGLGAAKLFNRHGAKVFVADINNELGVQVCKDMISEDGGWVKFVHCDVTSEAEVRNTVDQAMDEHGKLDVFFGNVGVVEMTKPKLVDFEASEFERVLRVNTVGMFLGAKHAARVMIPEKRGNLIFTASSASVMGGLCDHGYTSSKHAVVGLTKSMAAELGQFGIRVNCISPYAVKTPLLRRYMNMSDGELDDLFGKYSLNGVAFETGDVADAALYLASDESKYVTGHNLMVDGGFSVVDSGLNVYKINN